jgi:hypothetical protein
MEEKLQNLDDANSETSAEIAQSWNSAHEDMLASIADRSLGLSWMHAKCQKWFETANFWLTVPSIAVSTVAGSATIGMSSLFPNSQQTASTLIGLLTISTGVLTSINNFMKTSQFGEAHRSASLAHAKLHRIISCEVALRRDQRSNASLFIKVVRSEQDRLQEISPTMLEHVVANFRKQFKDRVDLEKPEIAGDLDHVRINRTSKVSPSTPMLLPAPDMRASSPRDKLKFGGSSMQFAESSKIPHQGNAT